MIRFYPFFSSFTQLVYSLFFGPLSPFRDSEPIFSGLPVQSLPALPGLQTHRAEAPHRCGRRRPGSATLRVFGDHQRGRTGMGMGMVGDGGVGESLRCLELILLDDPFFWFLLGLECYQLFFWIESFFDWFYCCFFAGQILMLIAELLIFDLCIMICGSFHPWNFGWRYQFSLHLAGQISPYTWHFSPPQDTSK